MQAVDPGSYMWQLHLVHQSCCWDNETMLIISAHHYIIISSYYYWSNATVEIMRLLKFTMPITLLCHRITTSSHQYLIISSKVICDKRSCWVHETAQTCSHVIKSLCHHVIISSFYHGIMSSCHHVIMSSKVICDKCSLCIRAVEIMRPLTMIITSLLLGSVILLVRADINDVVALSLWHSNPSRHERSKCRQRRI